MSLEKLGGRNLAIDHANHVFEGKMDKICQKVGGDRLPCPLGSYDPEDEILWGSYYHRVQNIRLDTRGAFNNHVDKRRGGGGSPNVHDCPR